MAIQNDLQNAELGYILCPFESYTNINGKPLVGGWISLYEAGTDTKYISYQDWLGNFNPFKIPIPADGRVVALGDPTKTYDAYLYNSFGDLVCSRLNLECNVAGNISIKGADTRINNTDGTLDISLRTLGNNVRQYTINTHNKELNVQEPLYFVENSNTATVIGFSGDNYATKDYVTSSISSKVDVTAYNQDITNITNNITALSADVDSKMDVSKLEYNNNGEISAYDGSAFAGQGGAGDPEVNELVHSNSATWNDVSAKLDTTAFSTVSGNFLTAIPDEYATKDYVQSSVSSKLDSTAFSTVSGSFLTAHQSLEDYLTKVSADGLYYPLNSNPSGYLTAHQSLDGYLTKSSADTLYQPTGDYATHDDLTAYQTVEGMTAYQPSGNYADATALDGKVDTSSFTAFSSTTNEKIEYISGALSGTYELSAGNGIDITDYPNEQKTVISVTAQGGNPEVENLVTAQSATWNSVTGKQDNLNFGYNNTAISSIDSSGLYDTSAHARINTLAGRINTLSSDKLDTTAFSTVSGNFLTAHQSLEGYATTEDVESAVSSKLDTTAFSDVSGSFLTAHQDISNKLDTTAFSDVSGSFLTAVPDTYLQNTDLTIVDNKITEISGVQLSAGTELEFEYDAADNISAINNSAISTTPAQALYAKLPLYAGVSGTSSFIGFEASAISADIARMLGVDETVLFDANGTSAVSAHLTESITAFERAKFYLHDDGGHCWGCGELLSRDLVASNNPVECGFTTPWNTTGMRTIVAKSTDDTFQNWVTDGYQWWGNGGGAISTGYMWIQKVIGIGRKQ